MIIGILFCWPSSTVNIFTSSNTTLHRPMEETELALFGSLSSIGALVSTPVAGYLLDIMGRKNLIVCGALLQVLGWALIAFCNQVELILTAVFVSGLGSCAFLVVPIFISEICQESIRGTITSFAMVFYALGMLISYVLGGLLAYKMMVYVCLTMAVIGVAMLVVIKESPVFLMKTGQEEAAQKAIAFYRNANVDSKMVMLEMTALRRTFNTSFDEDATPEEEALKPANGTEQQEKLSAWEFFKKSRSTRQAVIVTIVLMTASLFQGLVVVQVYAEPLFIEAVPNMSPTVASVIMAVLTIIFGIIAAYLTDMAGRRPLIIYASIATGVCCIGLGTQLHLHWGPSWVTAVGIYLFTIFYTIGGGTVPYVLGVEVFLPEVKSFMSMLIIEWAWVCNFLLLFIFNPLVSAIGLGPIFYLFAAVCMLTAVFCTFYLPETKGLPIDVIQTLFDKKSRTASVCNM